MLLYVIPAIIAAAITFTATWQIQATRYEARIAERDAETSRAARIASEQARRREKELQRYADEIARDAAKRQQALASRVATTDLVARGLRDDIARLDAGRRPDDPEGAGHADAAARARELLGSCAERYRGVAEKADGLRDQVMGLQDWARVVTKP